jgi:DNA polymerase elongation subunit (family B)
LTACIGWLLDVSIENDYAILSIKTEEDGQILKLRDSYRPRFVIPSRSGGSNHEHIRTVEQIVAGDKGGMIISPQIGLHEEVLALDYGNEFANQF